MNIKKKYDIIVVGAGHLVGDQGIISLLEMRGFTARKF